MLIYNAELSRVCSVFPRHINCANSHKCWYTMLNYPESVVYFLGISTVQTLTNVVYLHAVDRRCIICTTDIKHHNAHQWCYHPETGRYFHIFSIGITFDTEYKCWYIIVPLLETVVSLLEIKSVTSQTNVYMYFWSRYILYYIFSNYNLWSHVLLLIRHFEVAGFCKVFTEDVKLKTRKKVWYVVMNKTGTLLSLLQM